MKKVLILLAVVLTVFSAASSIHKYIASVNETSTKEINVAGEGDGDLDEKHTHRGNDGILLLAEGDEGLDEKHNHRGTEGFLLLTEGDEGLDEKHNHKGSAAWNVYSA